MADKPQMTDGQTTFEGGMDASRSPELIQPNQVAMAINTTFRGSYPKTRPRWMRRVLSFGSGALAAQAYMNQNLFQGAGYYNSSGNSPVFTVSSGGRIFLFSPQGLNFNVQDITPLKSDGVTLDRNSALLTKAYFCQAATYFVIQDDQSAAFIFDNSTLRRANPDIPEVPVGSLMAYGDAQLVVAQGNQFLVGDINGGPTNVISFTNTTYLAGGGSFALPINMGNVHGMIFNAQQDVAAGQGMLLVFGSDGAISVNLTIPRSQWQTSIISNNALVNIGTLADRALSNVNGDIFFRGNDGIRSYRDARAEFYGYGRTPMSYELSNVLNADSAFWLPFVSAIYFDNRYLLTTQGTRRGVGNVPVFQGIVAMDFVTVQALRYQQPPTFDGIWTGLDIYQLITGRFEQGIRAFAFVRGLDDAGNQELQLWELMKEEGLDNGITPISSSIDTRAFTYQNALQYKRQQYLRLWFDKIKSRLDCFVGLKPDQYPSWIPWQKWTYNAKLETCHNNDCALPNWQPEYRAGYNLKLAPEESVTDGDRFWTARTGFTFQLRIAWKGVARLTKMLLASESQDVPKFEALQMAPPDDPLTAIVARVVPAFTYYNEAQTYTCPAGTTGTPVTVAAGTFTSAVSLAAANVAAYASAQSMAVCTIYKPVVTNGVETGTDGAAFSYSVIASNSPTSYGATFPGGSGLSINTTTGAITGTIGLTVGTYTIPLTATNAGGAGDGTLTLNVLSGNVTVTLSAQGDNNPPAGLVLQAAVDGGAYANTTVGSTFSAANQFKLKASYAAGTYTAASLADLKATLVRAATITSKTSSSYAINATWTVTGGSSLSGQTSGSLVSLFTNGNLSPSPFSGGSSGVVATGTSLAQELNIGLNASSGNPIVIVNFTMELILNFT